MSVYVCRTKAQTYGTLVVLREATAPLFDIEILFNDKIKLYKDKSCGLYING